MCTGGTVVGVEIYGGEELVTGVKLSGTKLSGGENAGGEVSYNQTKFALTFKIYDTSPWRTFNDSTAHGVYYTQSQDGTVVYGIFTQWPEDDVIGKYGLIK